MFFKKNDEPHTEEYSDFITNVKEIVFYNENGQEHYSNLFSNDVSIKKVLNYVGKNINTAKISITMGTTGTSVTQKKTVCDEVYTLGAQNDDDFYFIELGISKAEVIVSISKTESESLTSIDVEAFGQLHDGITMLNEH